MSEYYSRNTSLFKKLDYETYLYMERDRLLQKCESKNNFIFKNINNKQMIKYNKFRVPIIHISRFPNYITNYSNQTGTKLSNIYKYFDKYPILI